MTFAKLRKIFKGIYMAFENSGFKGRFLTPFATSLPVTMLTHMPNIFALVVLLFLFCFLESHCPEEFHSLFFLLFH